MYKWAGRFKFILAFASALLIGATLGIPTRAQASNDDSAFAKTDWADFAREIEAQKTRDYHNGMSYLISGGLALGGGLWGSALAKDEAEKTVYALFQSIGIASMGYGIYVWQLGGEERSMYQTLQKTRFSPDDRSHFLKSYLADLTEREKRDRLIRALTHGLIAGLNLFSATQPENSEIKPGLYLIGGVNLLASLSFALEF